MQHATKSHLVSIALTAATLLAAGPLLRVAGTPVAPLTGQWDTMLRYEELRDTVGAEGPDDVIFVGSSVFRRGVIPAVVAEEIDTRIAGARPSRVFTFGAPGHGVRTYPTLVDLILGVDEPELVVLLVTPRSVDRNAERINRWTETVAASPYGRALGDPIALRGWLHRLLLDHFPLSRYAPTLRSAALGDARDRDGLAVTERGYVEMERREIRPAMLERQRELMGEWATDDRYRDALDRAVEAVRAAGAEAMLVDAPSSPILRGLMSDPERNLGGARRFMEATRERLGVHVAWTPEGTVPEQEYADLAHYTRDGAERYSRWLGAEIARAFPDLRLD